MYQVSILVLVDGALEVLFLQVCHEPAKFQSLFSWMVRSKKPGVFCQFGVAWLVSILVLVDGALEDRIQPEREPPGQFQSLFSWMVRSKSSVKFMTVIFVSFNPCSRGWCARSYGVSGSGSNDNWFQSLFSWMVRSKIG